MNDLKICCLTFHHCSNHWMAAIELWKVSKVCLTRHRTSIALARRLEYLLRMIILCLICFILPFAVRRHWWHLITQLLLLVTECMSKSLAGIRKQHTVLHCWPIAAMMTEQFVIMSSTDRTLQAECSSEIVQIDQNTSFMLPSIRGSYLNDWIGRHSCNPDHTWPQQWRKHDPMSPTTSILILRHVIVLGEPVASLLPEESSLLESKVWCRPTSAKVTSFLLEISVLFVSCTFDKEVRSWSSGISLVLLENWSEFNIELTCSSEERTVCSCVPLPVLAVKQFIFCNKAVPD